MGKAPIADRFYRRLIQSDSTPGQPGVNWKWAE